MADTEKTPEIITTTPMSMATTRIATVDVRDASAEGVKLMRERVDNQKQMLAIAIRLTSPSQWTVFSGTGRDGVHRETIYPTGGAADTILRRAFGLTWGEKEVVVERNEDGESEAVCSAWLMQGDRQIEKFEGRRRMGGFIKCEADMRKGAVENMKSVAVRDLLGLRFRTPAELREMGLEVGKLDRRAEFQSHADDRDSGVAAVPFGKNKGTPVDSLNDKQLDWYIDAAKAELADQSKSQFHAKTKKWLAALEAEYGKRGDGGASPGGEHAYGPPAMTAEEVAQAEKNAKS